WILTFGLGSRGTSTCGRPRAKLGPAAAVRRHETKRALTRERSSLCDLLQSATATSSHAGRAEERKSFGIRREVRRDPRVPWSPRRGHVAPLEIETLVGDRRLRRSPFRSSFDKSPEGGARVPGSGDVDAFAL